MDCTFCTLDKSKVLLENDYFFAIYDRFPVTEGHTLIVAKRHFENIFGMHREELPAYYSLILEVKEMLESDYQPDGYNLGINCGSVAGQSIFHFHMHVIPRYKAGRDQRSGRRIIEGFREYVKEIM